MRLKTNLKNIKKISFVCLFLFSVSCREQAVKPSTDSDNEKVSTTNTHNNSNISEVTSADVNEQNKSTTEDIASYISGHIFSVNGKGSISFTNGTITVKGSNFTLRGDYTITGSSSLSVSHLLATDGDFDPSNNNGSFGTIILNTDGTLSETLSDGQNVRNYILTPQKY